MLGVLAGDAGMIPGWLRPWSEIHRLRAEVDLLRATLSDTNMRSMSTVGGITEMEFVGRGPQLLAEYFTALVDSDKVGTNYIEFTFGSHAGPIVVTVMRPGGKTPHQLRIEAEAKLAEYIAKESK